MNINDPRLPVHFWEKVCVSQNVSYSDVPCWEWTGGLSTDGYGKTYVEGKRYAHRVAYTALVGEIPSDLECDHLCRNRKCVFPGHIELVPHSINVQRGDSGINFRDKVVCPAGHLYNEDNTYVRNSQGHRRCRECNKVAVRKYRSSK